MCCQDCFNDDFLKEFVRRNKDGVSGCAFCGSQSVAFVDPSKLAPYFEPVLDGYVLRRDGLPLAELWAADWQMFSRNADASAIVAAVLGPAIAGVPYAPRTSSVAPPGEAWLRLRKELQDENRFFPRNAPDKELFRGLMDALICSDIPDIFYRARIMRGDAPYAKGEMGAPPAELASDGRANPIGIRYLYLADNAQTAIAEVKPSKGALVSVASFSIVEGRRPKLIDLTSPKSTISPFRITSAVADVLASMSFLEMLGEELSVPTQPHRATRDYLASQYLCELIKVSGYDGVIYRSSLSKGRNFAFFDVHFCVPVDPVSVFKVSEVVISAEAQ